MKALRVIRCLRARLASDLPSDDRLRRKRRRAFMLLLVATFSSSIGRNGYLIACSWILVAKEFGSPAVAAFFAIISLVELLASPLAGWLSDRYDRRRQYLFADGIRVVTMLFGAVALMTPLLHWGIWLSAVAFAACDRMMLTSSQSSIPSLAEHLSASHANSLFFFVMQSGGLIAAVMTGVLLDLLPDEVVFLALATTFAISVGFMWIVPSGPERPRLDWAQRVQPLLINSRLIYLATVYAVLYTSGFMVSVVGPSYVLDTFSGTAIDFGNMEMAWSAGSIFGTLLLIALVRAIKVALVPLIVLCFLALGFALLRIVDFEGSLAIFAALGVLYNLGRVAVEVMLQACVPQDALGRAKGSLHGSAVMMGLAIFAGVGLVGNSISPASLFCAFGAFLSMAVLCLGLLHLTLRQ